MMPCWSMAKVVSLPEMVYLHTSPKVGEQSLSVASTWRSYLLQLIYTLYSVLVTKLFLILKIELFSKAKIPSVL